MDPQASSNSPATSATSFNSLSSPRAASSGELQLVRGELNSDYPTSNARGAPLLDSRAIDAPFIHEQADNHIQAAASKLVEKVMDPSRQPASITATYRLQFHGQGFRFPDAQTRTEYLHDLGVSHVYASPLTKSQSGSMHGYDVVDPTEINEELGGYAEFDRFLSSLREHGLGHVLDIVPNHMSVASDQNRWWLDVLKHGPSSRYARFFDIDWQPVRSQMDGRVLLPVLDGSSGEVLESGRLPIRFYDGAFYVECNGCSLPLDPKTCTVLLTPHLDDFQHRARAAGREEDAMELPSIVAALTHLPDRNNGTEGSILERQRESLVIQQRLHRLVQQSPLAGQHIDRNLKEINGTVGQPRSFDKLDRLLEQQAFRLVHWKASSDEINYRRFFDVSTLAALTVENLQVFETTHHQILKLAALGKIDAYRVDHVDGLFDPTQYLWRLQWGYLRDLGQHVFENDPEVRHESDVSWQQVERVYLSLLHQRLGGPHPSALLQTKPMEEQSAHITEETKPEHIKCPRDQWPLPVFVEKILGSDEPLPVEWPVRGTTGYDFLNLLNGLFVDPKGFTELLKTYQRLSMTIQPSKRSFTSASD